MSSSLIVSVTPVLEKREHPNADRLEIIRVKGWQLVVQKDTVEVGQNVLYIPPDSILPEEYADKLGIRKYLSPLAKNPDGSHQPGLRVRAVRLRGEASYGTIDSNIRPEWAVEENLAEILEIRKWEPPRPCLDGEAAPTVPAFHKYTSIENLGNFPDVFTEGEEVVVSEKLHGKNTRLSLIVHPDENGETKPQWMAGSHSVRRKPVDKNGRPSDFWTPLDDSIRRALLDIHTFNGKTNVIFFGELINTQKGFTYGIPRNELGFRLFDISINMKYMNHAFVWFVCTVYGIPMVPILYQGPFSWDKVEELVSGPTMLDPSSGIREGVVVKPVREEFSRLLPGDGRKIGKVINVDYLEMKTRAGNEEIDASDS